MCKNAIGSDRNHFGEAINTSVLFMIGMVFVVLGAFLAVVWWSYRSARTQEKKGEIFAPAGKLRWSVENEPS
jgi:heme/copper-type cytochrome/quinol oxidase subunit 2